MKHLPVQIKETLIAIGHSTQSQEDRYLTDIEHLRRYDSINRKGRDFWQAAAADLPDEEIANLTRGLAYVETEFRWTGGSASGVIWLFQVLTNRNANVALLDNLSEWILAKTWNPYNPFGTTVSLGARNYSEYMEWSSLRALAIGRYAKRDTEMEDIAKAERQLRRKMAAAGAEARNTQVRMNIIESLNLLPVAEKLERISSDPTYPPQFFPTSIAASATQEVLAALPEKVRVELARRLKGKRKGAWGSFSKRLTLSLGPIWNKKPWGV